MNTLPALGLAVPILGMLAVLLVGGRRAGPVAIGFLSAGLIVAGAVAVQVWKTQAALVMEVGGWMPPLGISLRADGLSAVMILVTAVVALAVGFFWGFRPLKAEESREDFSFWFLLLGVVAALNVAFLGNDLFTLYVALELIAFSGVPLVCLKGTPETYQAALRYLIFVLAGSALYLLGAVIIYGFYGTLDLSLLAMRVEPGLALAVAVSLMTIGLAAKTALFPLHIWLPPAHAGASPAASALLSALVIKGSFFVAVRIWFDLAPTLLAGAGSFVLGAMGAGAILVGGAMALQETRLKRIIAYSTVAQIGYLFLIFPIGTEPSALAGGAFQAVSHALAKAAMFLAAGVFVEIAGSDKLTALRGIGRVVPMTVFGFCLAAASLIGIPPSGGFVTKWLLLTAAFSAGQGFWAIFLFAGGLMAGGYLLRAVRPVFESAELSETPQVLRRREVVVLLLALGAILVGMVPREIVDLISIGRPVIEEVGR